MNPFRRSVLLWSEQHRDGGSCVPPAAANPSSPALTLPVWPAFFHQGSVSSNILCHVELHLSWCQPFTEHLACQMLLQIKDGFEPKSWVQTPSDFGKVCILVLWLCSIPASFQSYLVTVFIFSCNQKLQRNVTGTEWVDVSWENSKTLPGWKHAQFPWSIYWSYKKDYSMDKNSLTSLPFLHCVSGHTFHIKLKYRLLLYLIHSCKN